MSSNGDDAPKTAKAACLSLPAVLVAQTLSFLPDARSLLSALAVCKNWRNLPQERLEIVWKTLYFAQFESHSANENCVAIDGRQTSWRRRFLARMRVERCWQRGKFRLQHAIIGDRIQYFQFASSLKLLVGSVTNASRLVLIKLPMCAIAARLELPATVPQSCLAIDEGTSLASASASSTTATSAAPAPPLLAVGCTNGDVCVFDLRSNKQLTKLALKGVRCLDVRAGVLAVAHNLHTRIYRAANGERLGKITHERFIIALQLTNDGRRLFTRDLEEICCFDVSRAAEPVVVSRLSLAFSPSSMLLDRQRARILLVDSYGIRAWQPESNFRCSFSKAEHSSDSADSKQSSGNNRSKLDGSASMTHLAELPRSGDRFQLTVRCERMLLFQYSDCLFALDTSPAANSAQIENKQPAIASLSASVAAASSSGLTVSPPRTMSTIVLRSPAANLVSLADWRFLVFVSTDSVFVADFAQ